MRLFLEGRGEELIPAMRAEMEAAAEDLDFERAAKLRDDVAAIEHVLERQDIVSGKGDDLDVLAVAQSAGGEAAVQITFVRNGKILGSEHFPLSGTRVDDLPDDLLASFVSQFYQDAATVPREVLVQHDLPESHTLQAFLERRREQRVRLAVPQRGRKRKILEMTAASAEENLKQSSLRWLSNEQKLTAALTELSDALALPRSTSTHRVLRHFDAPGHEHWSGRWLCSKTASPTRKSTGDSQSRMLSDKMTLPR